MLRMGLLLLFAAAGLAAQDSNPLAKDPKAAEVGRGMFRIYCAPCHGIRAQGGRGPDLTRGVFVSGDRDADLFRTISDGISGTEMGGYSSVGDDGVWRLVSYIRSLGRPEAAATVPGDAARGAQLFREKGRCTQCHAVAGSGSRLGPDLSRAGRQRSLAYLEASLLDPDDDIVPGHATLTVVTRDGKIISGLQKGLDNFSGQLIDLTGNFYSFERSEVKSMKRETRSLMPSYRGVLSETELTDLLAYLAGLRGEEVKP